jgi:signal transduction histidine kinase
VTALAWLELLLMLGVAVVLLLAPRLRGLLVAVTVVQIAGTGMAPFTEALGQVDDVAFGADVVRAAAVAAAIPLFAGLFPDGTWHPRWFRRWWPLFVVIESGTVIGFAVFGQAFADVILDPIPGTLVLLIYLGAQIHRYRRVSDWAGRQQAKWVIGALALILLNGVLIVLAVAFDAITSYQLVAVVLTYVGFAVLGIGLALGLLRYRLYDVDLVLRRTFLYVAALAVLAAAYVGLVAAASATIAATAAPLAGAVLVAVLALGGGVVAYLLRERIRRRLLGGHGLATAIAALARDGARATTGSDLAETIASGLGLPYAAVVDPSGTTLWEHGVPGPDVQRESVVDGAGTQVGTLLLGAPRGSTRLDRYHRRVLGEVLPFVVLVLRARAEADELRAARAAAASAREDERRRLRRDLHDGVGPLLAGQLLTLDTIRVAGERPALIAHLEAQARSAISEVRRVAHDLRPPTLDAGGLPGALAGEAERLDVAGLPVRLDVDLAGIELSAAHEVAALRIAQEALTNVVKHAAAGHVEVTLRADPTALHLTVSDDGRGRRHAPDGIGSTSMRERAVELGGTLTSGPRSDGTGTTVCARIPL